MRTKRNRVMKWLLALAALAVLVHFAFLGKHNLFDLYRLKQKEERLILQIEEGEREVQRLYVEIDKLKTDSTYIEKIAREEYKMGRDGERIFIVKENNKK